MASLINVIVPFDVFVDRVKDLMEKYQVHLYLEKRDAAFQAGYVKLDVFADQLDMDYSQFFFSAQEVTLNDDTNFYADDVFDYCIEGKGGRQTDTDVELLALRLISKNPMPTIKSFFNAVHNRLKKDKDFDAGIYSGSGVAFYKNILYLKSAAQDKVMWFDFKRKDKPITLE